MVRPTTLLTLVLAAALSVTLFTLKYQVRALEDELAKIRQATLADRQALHVLRAEWSLLNDPDRLRRLAERHLDLRPIEADQLGTLADLPPPQLSVGGAAATPVPSTTPFPTTASAVPMARSVP